MKVAKIRVGDRTAAAVLEGEEVRLVGPWADAAGHAAFGAPRMSLAELKQRAAAASEVTVLDRVSYATPTEPLTKKRAAARAKYAAYLEDE